MELQKKMRIVAFGDSITEGSAIHGQFPNWPELMMEMLPDIEVINAGVGGNTTANGLARIEKDVIAQAPDSVIVAFGMNDHVLIAKDRNLVAIEVFETNLHEIIRRCRDIGAGCVLMTPNRVLEGNKDEYYYSRHDSDLYAAYSGAQTLLNRYADIVRKVAAEMDCPLVDMNRISAAYPLEDFLRTWENSGYNDGVHPAALGTKIIAESLVQCYREILSK